MGWREVLVDTDEVLQGNAPHHPVALALATAMQEQYLPAYYLKRIIDARVRYAVAA